MDGHLFRLFTNMISRDDRIWFLCLLIMGMLCLPYITAAPRGGRVADDATEEMSNDLFTFDPKTGHLYVLREQDYPRSTSFMPSKVAKVDAKSPDPGDKETLQLDLEGFTPEDYDCEGISMLIRNIFPIDSHVNTLDLASHIVLNNSIGTVVKPSQDDTEEDDDDGDEDDVVLAITTVVSIGQSEAKKFPVVAKVRDYLAKLISKAQNQQVKEQCLNFIQSESHICLFLNERFDSLPLSICAEAVANLPREMKQSKLSPKHLVMLAHASKSSSGEEVEFTYPEIEHIRPFARYELEIKASSVSDTATSSDCETVLFLVIPMDKYSDILEVLRTFE